MKWLRYWIVSLMVLCCSPLAFAGSDPISWSVSGNAIPANSVKFLYYGPVTYTFKNNLPYKLVCPLNVIAQIVGQFNVTSNTCQNNALDPGDTCSVTFDIQPTVNGVHSITLIMQYGKDIVPLPAVTTVVSDGPIPLVTGTLTPAFPATVGAGEQKPFGFTYTNNNNGTVTGISCPNVTTIDQNQTNSSVLTDTVCTCGPTLAPGASCFKNGNVFQFGYAGHYAIHHTLTYTGGSTTLSTSTDAFMNIESAIVQNFPLYPPITGTVTGAGEIYTLTFRFTNGGTDTVYGVTSSKFTPPAPTVGIGGIINGGNDNVGDPIQPPNDCNVGTLASGSFCDVDVLYQSGLESPPSYQMSVGFNYKGGINQVPQTAGPIPGEIQVTNTFASPTDDLPASIGTGEDHDVKFTFTNNGVGTAWNITDPETTFVTSANGSCVATSTTCTGPFPSTLNAGDSCTAICRFRATTPGNSFVTQNFTYAGGVVPLTSTTATASQKVIGEVFSPSPFPSKIGVNVGQAVTFRFTNTGSTAVQGTPNITITQPGSPPVWVLGANSCTGTSLAAGASCDVSGTYTGQVTGDVTIAATFNYSGPPVVASADTNIGRVVTLVNRCNQNVWYSFNGSVTQFGCATTADCPSGSVCNPAANAGGGACYWENPEPLSGSLQLPPMIGTTPSTSTVIVPDRGTTLGGIWQGQIAGRTSCTGSAPLVCETATCGGDPVYPKGSCAPGAIFGASVLVPNQEVTPVTRAEFKLIKTAVDEYGVQASNGINLPMAMGPTSSTFAIGTPYTCARPGYAGIDNPGDTAGVKSFSACNWTPVPPAITPDATDLNGRNYVWVRKSAADTACVSNATCLLPGEVCGLRYDATSSPTFKRACGVPIGYWTANQACLTDAVDAQTFFNCNNASSTDTPPGSLVKNLYSCSPVVGLNLLNCYISPAPNPNCCGCVNWNETAGVTGVPLTGGSGSQACPIGNINTSWTGDVQPTIKWIKTMCPQLITYPDDTGSSRFTCNTPDSVPSGTNTAAYSVTFCPEVFVAPLAKKKVKS